RVFLLRISLFGRLKGATARFLAAGVTSFRCVLGMFLASCALSTNRKMAILRAVFKSASEKTYRSVEITATGSIKIEVMRDTKVAEVENHVAALTGAKLQRFFGLPEIINPK